MRPKSIPILGARRLDPLRDDAGCLDLVLPPEAAGRRDEASRIDPGFPHEFLAGPGVVAFFQGGARPLIDD